MSFEGEIDQYPATANEVAARLRRLADRIDAGSRGQNVVCLITEHEGDDTGITEMFVLGSDMIGSLAAAGRLIEAAIDEKSAMGVN